MSATLIILCLLVPNQDQASIRQHDYPNANERGCNRADIRLSSPGHIQLDLDPSCTPQFVCYRVMGPVVGWTIQSEGEPAVGDLNALVQHLTAGSRSERERAERLFEFVVNDMRDWFYPAQGIDLTVEDLGALIWNFGYGFCYDLGRLQAGLWHLAGLRSRIVGWPQHTLAEVYYEGSWHLYDLQHRNYYLNSSGDVAGFDEIKLNPGLLNQKLDTFGLDPIGYPPEHLVHWYKIAQPKFEDSEQGPHWKTDKSFTMDLRFGEFFEVVYSEPVVAYHPDSWTQYYGEKTLRKDPPWLVQGRLTYAPNYLKSPAKWIATETPAGTPGYRIRMKSPFIFTEGWIKIPDHTSFDRIWVDVWEQSHFVGRLVGGNAIFSKLIEGSNQFDVIVEADDIDQISRCAIETRLQMSHIGLPKIAPGSNQIPVSFRIGRPHVTLWYLEDAPDLQIVQFSCAPAKPSAGELVQISYQVENKGSGKSPASTLTVFNNTTSFLSETTERVGIASIPPLNPGQKVTVELVWEANTRMTWYGQDPHVQLFDAWIDFEHDLADADRENNRRQNYLRLNNADLKLPAPR